MSTYAEIKAELEVAGITYPRQERFKDFIVFLGIVKQASIIEKAGKMLQFVSRELNKDEKDWINPYPNINQTGRTLLTSYMITENHEEVIGEDAENLPVVNAAKALCRSINESDKGSILLRFATFQNELTEWKRDDSIRLAHVLGKCYQELKLTRERIGETIENSNLPTTADEQWHEQLGIQMETVLQRLKGLRDDWESFINLYDPERMNMIDPQQITDMMQKAFWDKMHDDLSQMPPSFDSAVSTLEHLRESIEPFVVTDNDKAELNESLDIQYIKQRIEHGCFDAEYMGSILRYIVRWIRRLEAPQHDQDTDTWLHEMEQAMLNQEPTADLLTKRFFPVALDKMHEIIDVVMAIHRHSSE